jgi:hypothetical protein
VGRPLGSIRLWNIWLDLVVVLSPSHFKLALHEAISAAQRIPDDAGGDNWRRETYGAMQTVRRLIAEVLDEKLAGGCFSRATAGRHAPDLRQRAVFKLG